jgi:hypothetical protein
MRRDGLGEGAWYQGGMSYLPEMDGVKILPAHEAGAGQTGQGHGDPLAVLERRANIARAYIARGRRDGQGQKFDPVLASHLGLQERAK